MEIGPGTFLGGWELCQALELRASLSKVGAAILPESCAAVPLGAPWETLPSFKPNLGSCILALP